MRKKLDDLITNFQDKIEQVKSLHQLMILKSEFIGKKSEIAKLYQQIGKLAPKDRPEYGKQLNLSKKKILKLVSEQEKNIKEKIFSSKETILDLTMPSRDSFKGALHPITQISREIEDIFISMGFDISDYYEIEDEYHNFDALNTPPDHSSRNTTDTFYTKMGKLLRTQTSTEQIRVMENYSPPIKIISLGRCYRSDKPDASHSTMFNQVEALVVETDITFTDLKDTLQIFVEKMFGSGIKSRFRPHFFPFTEPSGEVDISCVKCSGSGCNICKKSGWLEVGGCGMVDTNVFDIVGIDKEKFTGFAFGLGIERLTMLKYNIPDIRMFYENDLRFLRQFR